MMIESIPELNRVYSNKTEQALPFSCTVLQFRENYTKSHSSIGDEEAFPTAWLFFSARAG